VAKVADDRISATDPVRDATLVVWPDPPTIIARFLAEVDAALRHGGAAGAAEHTWRAAAIFEPYGARRVATPRSSDCCSSLTAPHATGCR
jgi:hypothetical protein